MLMMRLLNLVWNGVKTMGKRHEAALKAKPILQKGAQHLDDAEALVVKAIYAVWEAGASVKVHEKRLYGDELYRCIQAHTTQADWTPDVSPTLWEGIDETNAGTLDNPIPYDGNMVLEEGKYYSQNGVIYFCFRGSVNPVYHALSDLVSIYVEEVSA